MVILILNRDNEKDQKNFTLPHITSLQKNLLAVSLYRTANI